MTEITDVVALTLQEAHDLSIRVLGSNDCSTRHANSCICRPMKGAFKISICVDRHIGDQHADTHVIGWHWPELLQSLCADYFDPHPADDGIDECRNRQWQVGSVGVDNAHAEIAAHVLGQHRHQSAGCEIGRPQYRC